MVIERMSSRVSPIAAMTVAATIIAAAVMLDFLTPAHFNPSILYIPALVMVALARKRRLVWAAVIGCIFLTLAGMLWGPRPDPAIGHDFRFYMTMNRVLVILSLAGTGVVAHLW